MLFEAVRLVAVGDEHQTAVHDLHRDRTADIKARRLKPLPFKVDRGRGCGFVVLRDVSHGVITFCFRGFILSRVLLRMRLSHHSTPR
ncbi:putative Histidine kinase [Xenorhabdus cabanillasii JM26]|uniref:Histidine kinase n=1 Tax=Xenorhabdus cabanillasii JM26 TaxID=1427517 RepID=W1JC37_9GAMM|nr:putative Histidine kinase [Xenorhabdus cabanillasii JM26]